MGGKSFTTVTLLVLGCLAAAGATAAACSSSNASTAGGDGGTHADGTTSGSDSSPGGNDAPSGGDAPADAGSAGDSTGGGPDGPSGGETGAADGGIGDGAAADAPVQATTFSVPDQVASLAYDGTTNTLYAPMVDPNGHGAGIAVINAGTGALTTTIPAIATDAGPAPPYFFSQMLAVDETNDLLYAVRQASTVVDVYDGASNAYKATFDVATVDPQCQTGLGGVSWLAIDPAASLLYAACPGPFSGARSNEVSVIGTASGYSLSHAINLTDLGGTGVAALALDTTNHLLFVSNSSPNYNQFTPKPLLVDVVDTTTFTEKAGAQQSLGTGNSLGTLGGPGYATLLASLTGADGGVSYVFFSLEPGNEPLPPGFGAITGFTFLPDKPGYYAVVGRYEDVPTEDTIELKVDPTEGVPPSLFATESFTPPLDGGAAQAAAFVATKSQYWLATYGNGLWEWPRQ